MRAPLYIPSPLSPIITNTNLITMGWFLAILLFSLISGSVSEVEDNKFSSDVVVGGIVICDICSEHDFTPKTHFISGSF